MGEKISLHEWAAREGIKPKKMPEKKNNSIRGESLTSKREMEGRNLKAFQLLRQERHQRMKKRRLEHLIQEDAGKSSDVNKEYSRLSEEALDSVLNVGEVFKDVCEGYKVEGELGEQLDRRATDEVLRFLSNEGDEFAALSLDVSTSSIYFKDKIKKTSISVMERKDERVADLVDQLSEGSVSDILHFDIFLDQKEVDRIAQRVIDYKGSAGLRQDESQYFILEQMQLQVNYFIKAVAESKIWERLNISTDRELLRQKFEKVRGLLGNIKEGGSKKLSDLNRFDNYRSFLEDFEERLAEDLLVENEGYYAK